MKKSYSVFTAIRTIIISSLLVAFVLIYFSPSGDYDKIVTSGLLIEPTVENVVEFSPNEAQRIGLVVGHLGYDDGFVCGPDIGNVREVDVNLRIAILARDYLQKLGYTVDLMQEFDAGLSDYTGLALVAIHNDTCQFIDSASSGFKIRSATSGIYPAEMKRLNDCLRNRYSDNTGLPYLGDMVNSDNDIFYDYSMVNDYTTISIIETGFLNLDYRVLSEKTDQVAKGIADGILCYINNEPTSKRMVQQYPAPTEVTPLLQTRYIIPGITGFSPSN